MWFIGTVLAWHAQRPGVSPEHGINRTWRHMSAKVRTEEVEAGGFVVRGYPLLQSEVKVAWDTRDSVSKTMHI